jgi:hypothetical protein
VTARQAVSARCRQHRIECLRQLGCRGRVTIRPLKAIRRAIGKAKSCRWNLSTLESMAAAYGKNQIPDYSRFVLSWTLDELDAVGLVRNP